MCLATGKVAGQNLYEALHFQHSLARLLEGLFEVDHQLGA
jgi:hypothetical protein